VDRALAPSAVGR